MEANLWVKYCLVIMKLDAKVWVVLISMICGYNLTTVQRFLSQAISSRSSLMHWKGLPFGSTISMKSTFLLLTYALSRQIIMNLIWLFYLHSFTLIITQTIIFPKVHQQYNRWFKLNDFFKLKALNFIPKWLTEGFLFSSIGGCSLIGLPCSYQEILWKFSDMRLPALGAFQALNNISEC